MTKKSVNTRILCAIAAGLLLVSSCNSGNGIETDATSSLIATETDKPTAETTAAETQPGIKRDDTPGITYAEFIKTVQDEYNLANAYKLNGIENKAQDVIASVARAYYNQSFAAHQDSQNLPQTQYDMNNYRRNVNATPEDATAQRTLYLDCSSFVNSVYYYTFGRNIIDSGAEITTEEINKYFSSKTVGADCELMYYITGKTLSTVKANASEAQKLIDEIKSVLEPGDIINYRKSGAGHVIMYLGNGKIIHSIGSANASTDNGKTDPKTSVEKATADEKSFGTVFITDWDEFFTETVTPASQNDGRTSKNNMYLFASGIVAVAIFRPTNRKDGSMKGLQMTSHAIAHYLYDGLDIEKSATRKQDETAVDLYYGASVYAGDEIKFTVTATNLSDADMRPIFVEEKIPENLEFVSASAGALYFSGENKVCFHTPVLSAGTGVTYSYTLKVKDGLTPSSNVEDSETYVNGIRTNRLFYEFSALKIDDKAIETAIKSLLGTKMVNPWGACKAVYEKLGICQDTLNQFTKVKDVFDMLCPLGEIQFEQTSCAIVSRVLYGGTTIGCTEITEADQTLQYDDSNVRVRRILENNLENGDIICAFTQNTGKTYWAFIYYDHNLYSFWNNALFSKVNPWDRCSGTSLQDLLDTLTAYNMFVVLRPKLAG